MKRIPRRIFAAEFNVKQSSWSQNKVQMTPMCSCVDTPKEDDQIISA
jgi:hypothetical protein